MSGNLTSVADALRGDLRKASPPNIQGLSEELHECAPFLRKGQWTQLGDALKEAEQPTVASIPGNKWISIRCDGTGFSRYLKRLRSSGVLSEGYSETFASMMQDSCRTLIEKFNGICGFTQSDEIAILISPASVINGVQHCHPYNGRVQKLCSLAAATLTAHFNHLLVQLCIESNLPVDLAIATFDCRVGMYDSKDDALSLLLWRAYDAGVNGVSDAVHHQKGNPDRSRVMKLPTGKKLQWLQEQGLLPMARHQREGTYYTKRKVMWEATNRATGQQVTVLRSRLVHVPGNLIRLYRDGEMFPPDDVLPFAA